MGHMGIPWFWEAISVVLRHPNVYIDISNHPIYYKYFPWDVFTAEGSENKVLYASDHPLINWNETIPATKKLPISESFRKLILYENAKKLLNI